MNKYLEPKMPNFFVPNLRNRRLLRAIRASNLNMLILNLLCSWPDRRFPSPSGRASVASIIR